MEEINIILNKYPELFSKDSKVEKINVGFTNTIYSIDDSYIIKICTNKDNEENFQKEINFYNSNKENELLPKLYHSSTDKKDIPYMYEIIEKIKSVSLYNVWHTTSEVEKEEIIKQLCTAMKIFHSNKGENGNWLEYQKNKFLNYYNKVKTQNIFNEKEKQLLEYAYSKFGKYLGNNEEYFLTHNDLHFDNIFYNDGKIKVIDFERSFYAPKDYELNILNCMISKPWKFASEETEKFTDSSDYGNIKVYLEKYYNELVNNPVTSQRVAIYHLIYYLESLCKYPNDKDLKEDVIATAKVITLKDQLHFEDLTTPEELMDFMDVNMEYGWIDFNNNRHINTLKNFRETYRTSSILEIINTGLGTCIEQTKLIKYFFDKNGIENKLYCGRHIETDDNFEQDIKMHTFVLFKQDDNWYHFEHSNPLQKGIHKYTSIDDAIKEIAKANQNDIKELTEISDIPDELTFKEFNLYVNEQQNKLKQKTH